MKKEKRSKYRIGRLLIFAVFLLLAAGCESQKKIEKSDQSKESYEFRIYNAKSDIKDFQFIHNKNGLVVEWKFDEKERKKSLKSPDSSDWVEVNSNYLVRQRNRVRGIIPTKKMKSDEYAHLEIYDLTGSKAKRKEVDLWKMMVEYVKNDDFELYGSFPTIRKMNGNDYAIIKIMNQTQPRYLLLNLKTLKIDKEITEEEVNEKNRVYLFISILKGYTAGIHHFYNGFLKDKSFKGDINLRASYPTAFKLFSKPEGFAYKVINSENGAITNGKELIDLESEFLKLGSTVYDHAYLSKELSIENKDTKISQFDEIQKYYNGKPISSWN
ncbi:hypothetical protein [uncultured Streptococcus sp.]|uniref:hypothetical protein n=1 Tax=uncultured Streptococcus sp. TaxID=83427 RepID=UPI0028DB30AB|nr:hypothetical protein [uncultured Streptococcus sp.]